MEFTTFDLILLVVIIFTMVGLFFLYHSRFHFFGTNLTPDSSQEEWNSKGFGYYEQPVSTSCISKTNSCLDGGVVYKERICVQNEETRRGCLQGETQTFAPIVVTTPCIPQCRISIWKDNGSTPCSGSFNGQPCVAEGTTGTYRRSLECIPNDPSGVNNCFVVVDPKFNSTLPPGCTLQTSEVVCSIGSVYTETLNCLPSQPVCGEYGVNVNGVINQCYSTQSNFLPSSTCLLFPSSIISGQGPQLFTQGYTTEPLVCVEKLGDPYSTATNATCLQPNCSNNLADLETELVNQQPGDSIYYCPTPTQPECASQCIYYDPGVFPNSLGNFTPWATILKGLNTFHLSTSTYGTQTQSDLTINNLPCNSLGNGNVTQFGDCYGNPNGTLDFTPMIFAEIQTFLNNQSQNGLPSFCTRSDISKISSSLFLIKPLEVVQDPSTNETLLRCQLIVMAGGNYIGMLQQDNSYNSNWVQLTEENQSPTNINIYYLGIPQLQSDSTYLCTFKSQQTFSGNVPFNINNVSITSIKINPITNFTLRGLDSTQTVVVNDPSPSSVNFHYYLTYRQTRNNPNTCNAYQTHPQLPNYPIPDIGYVENDKPSYNDIVYSSY